jgi:hypothetical protein
VQEGLYATRAKLTPVHQLDKMKVRGGAAR